MNYEQIIDGYNELRENCLMIAKNNPELFDEGAWFKNAIIDSDITLHYSEEGVHCYGSAFTTKTMSSEHFQFMIPFERLK